MNLSKMLYAQQDTCVGIHQAKIFFPRNTNKLATIALIPLHNLALEMKTNPECKAVISGQGNDSYRMQQLSWDRTNACINYLVDKEGIPRDRFIFMYGQGCLRCDYVIVRCASKNEDGPSNTPPPAPNLRRR